MVCCCSASDLDIAWPLVWPMMCSVSQDNMVVCHKGAMLAHILKFIFIVPAFRYTKLCILTPSMAYCQLLCFSRVCFADHVNSCANEEL